MPLRLLSVALACLLAACSSTPRIVESQRKVFHNWDKTRYAGKSFAVLPADRAKAESMEFMTHAARLSIYLKDSGYAMVRPGETPDFVVWMDYSAQPAGRVTHHQLSLVIRDKALERAGAVGIAYECKVTSDVAISDSASIVPILIDGAMWDFPGKAGYVEDYSHHADFVDRVYRLNSPEEARR